MDDYEVPVAVDGIDFDDDATADALECAVPQVSLELRRGTPVLVLELPGPPDMLARQVSDSLHAAQRTVPALQPRGLYVDLVSQSDIATRAGVSREAARKWVGQPGFPRPIATVGASTHVWFWPHAARWLMQHRGLDLGDRTPGDQSLLRIELALAAWNRADACVHA